MLGPVLAGIGAWRLARRLGSSPWASLAGATAYAGCGYIVSVTGSNLPYAIGAGSVPIAVDAVLGVVEAPSIRRLAWAGAALALIAYAGEPQAMLIAGLLSGAWALGLAFPDWRRAARNLGLVAGCGVLATGAVLLALASTGPALGIDRVLFALVPIASIFRFAEKLIAPASLLFALAAALGADLALGGTRRAAARLAAAALLVGVGAAAAAPWSGRSRPNPAQALAAHGETPPPPLPPPLWPGTPARVCPFARSVRGA